MLLVLALLGGSLICLLVINTTLGAASFRISQLQKKSATLSTEEESLRQQVAVEQSTDAICQRAYALGMRTPTTITILDLRTGQIDRLPGQPGMGVQLCAPPAPPAAPTKSTPVVAKKSGGRKPAAAATPSASPTQGGTRTGNASPSPAASTTPGPTRSRA